MPSPVVVIVGATRGLGLHLAKTYAARPSYKVFGTARKSNESLPSPIHSIPSIDLSQQSAGRTLAKSLADADVRKIDVLVITAGVFKTETLQEPDWEGENAMYTTSAIAPPFVVSALDAKGLLDKGTKIVLVSSEGGSIGLRVESEGGGNYAHHASKAALNMVGKLLAFDLKEKGVTVGLVHPGFMRTEMTKGVGFDKFWDKGGAVTPDIAAEGIVDFIDTLDISKTGTFWAPRGSKDIGSYAEAMGISEEENKKKTEPVELPW